MFQELARIFSEDNNQLAQRKLLIREGTAKFADTFGHNDRHLQKIIKKQQSTMNVSSLIAESCNFSSFKIKLSL